MGTLSWHGHCHEFSLSLSLQSNVFLTNLLVIIVRLALDDDLVRVDAVVDALLSCIVDLVRGPLMLQINLTLAIIVVLEVVQLLQELAIARKELFDDFSRHREGVGVSFVLCLQVPA